MLRDFPLPGRMATGGARGADVPIRDAATVMLVRPAPSGNGVEVFTFRRRPSLVFAAGMLVFPGGAVEPGDDDPDLPWAGPSPQALTRALSADVPRARATVAAAVRETFEECGVLLASPADGGDGLSEPLDSPVWEGRRQALLGGELTLASLLRDAGLVLRADLLRPWAHWLTPPGESRRFDTRFFVAVLPAGQQARDLGGEGERAAWLEPRAVVDGYRAGDVPMLPPTVVSMEELAAAASVDELLTTVRRPRAVSPWLEQTGVEDDGSPRYVLRVDLDGLGGGEPGPQG